ncbi:MAG TPA: ribosomal protein S18-alanine N-acetyltransferase [Clostridia bacterium]|nr:ribosomal protein S18-alanine N-acetyltransferase [Clostridia bacterium]
MAAKEPLAHPLKDELMIVPMAEEHLDQVLAIEQVSFPTPWSRNSYLRELSDNQFAYYYVCLLGDKVLGYMGMWLIIDEAHVTTIAVHPDYRGRALGRVLLEELMARAAALGADKITLEVRPSNHVAQRLYRRVGFVPAGIRKGYYTDTKEDAIIMWKHLLDFEK